MPDFSLGPINLILRSISPETTESTTISKSSKSVSSKQSVVNITNRSVLSQSADTSTGTLSKADIELRCDTISEAITWVDNINKAIQIGIESNHSKIHSLHTIDEGLRDSLFNDYGDDDDSESGVISMSSTKARTK